MALMQIEIKVLVKVEEEVTNYLETSFFSFFHSFAIYVSVEILIIYAFDILGRLHSLSLYRERRGRIFNSESHVSSSSGGNMTTPNTRPSNMVIMASNFLLSSHALARVPTKTMMK